ncbi:MAG: SGNH/GDSL hydrolase family protein [Planctomycetota bacterium]|jgi:lysophospholipase L1-like esterase
MKLPVFSLTFVTALPVILGTLFVTSLGEQLLAFIVARPTWHARALLVLAVVMIIYGRTLLTFARFTRAGYSLERYTAMMNDPEAWQRRRRRTFRLVAMGVAGIMALLFSELAFRVFDIRPPRIHPPYLDHERSDNTRTALGIREPWDSLPLNDGRLRIGFVGDSLTYGQGVERDDAFPQLIEGLLNDRLDREIVTINFGEPGTDAETQLQIYQRLQPVLSPHIVVHVPYLNDLNAGMDAAAMLKSIYRIRDEELWLGNSSYLIRFVEKQIRFFIARRRTRAYFKGGRTPRDREKSWKLFDQQVADLKAEVEAGGTMYCMALFPCLLDLDDYWLTESHERMAKLAAGHDAPFLDLLDVFEGRNAVELRVNLGNEHPNAEGHLIAAKRITQWLAEEIIPTWEATHTP